MSHNADLVFEEFFEGLCQWLVKAFNGFCSGLVLVFDGHGLNGGH